MGAPWDRLTQCSINDFVQMRDQIFKLPQVEEHLSARKT